MRLFYSATLGILVAVSHRRTLFIVSASVLCALAVGLIWRMAGEPRFRGRALSVWLSVCVLEYGSGQKSPEARVAEESVRQIGTNAIPYLLKWMRDGSESWQTQLDGVLQKVASVGDSRGGTLVETVSRRRDFAMAGFYALGAKGAPAVPKLLELMLVTNQPSLSAAAAEALGAIGSEGLPALLKALKQSGAQQHVQLVNQLGFLRNMGSNAAPTIPILVADSRDSDPNIAGPAVYALGKLAIEADLSVPALTNCLASPNHWMRSNAATALGRFGPMASEAIPALVAALGDSSEAVRVAATNALAVIRVKE